MLEKTEGAFKNKQLATLDTQDTRQTKQKNTTHVGHQFM